MRHGESGFVLPLTDFPARAADLVAGLHGTGELAALRQGARRHYEESLNWAECTAALLELIGSPVRSG